MTCYDAASIAEVRLVRGLRPESVLCFMPPIKAPSVIGESYFRRGVKSVCLDSAEKLDKIIDARRDPSSAEMVQELRLCVRLRLRVFSEFSKFSLASKFVCDLIEALALLQQTCRRCDWLSVCFHVGSRSMEPSVFVQARGRTRAAITTASVEIDAIDAGGGFPR